MLVDLSKLNSVGKKYNATYSDHRADFWSESQSFGVGMFFGNFLTGIRKEGLAKSRSDGQALKAVERLLLIQEAYR